MQLLFQQPDFDLSEKDVEKFTTQFSSCCHHAPFWPTAVWARSFVVVDDLSPLDDASAWDRRKDELHGDPSQRAIVHLAQTLQPSCMLPTSSAR